MKKILIYVSGGLIIVIGGFFALNSYIYKEKQGDQKPALSPREASYVIDGKLIRLINGLSETEAAPGSASKITTRYFGNEATYDFDKDGRLDTAHLITQETGGSGIFYYVVVALNKEAGYVGSSAFFLGDRIAPQTTEVTTDGVVMVNYAERKPGEDFTVRPSMGKTTRLRLNPETMQFIELSLENTTEPSRMTLDMKTWIWVSALYNDGTKITPLKSDMFTLTFSKNNTFSAKTDCNGIGGDYFINKEKLSFEKMMSTLMACENSQEGDFTKILNATESYYFTPQGELILNFKFDSGSATFR